LGALFLFLRLFLLFSLRLSLGVFFFSLTVFLFSLAIFLLSLEVFLFSLAVFLLSLAVLLFSLGTPLPSFLAHSRFSLLFSASFSWIHTRPFSSSYALLWDF